MNPPDAVKDYSSQANRIMGAILTRVISKITSFPEGTSPSEIKKVLDRVERNIPHIAAWVRRHPTNEALVGTALDKLYN